MESSTLPLSGGQADDAGLAVAPDFPMALFRLDRDGRVIHVNDAMVQLLGYPDAETLLSTPAGDLFSEEHRPESLLRLIDRDGPTAGTETELNHRSGRRLWVQLYAHAVRDDGGSILYVEGAAVDVTAQKSAFDALGIVRRRLESFFERSPVAHWVEDFSALMAWLDRLRAAGVTDLRSYLDANPDEIRFGMDLIRIVDVNPAALALVGASNKEEILHRNLGLTESDESLDAFKEQIIAAWEGRSSVRIPGAGRSVDGKPLEYIMTWVDTVNGGSDLGTVVVSLEDITELNEAQRRLAHLGELKDKFIDAITHELRTPLTGVLGFAELLRDRFQDDFEGEAYEYTDMLVSAAAAGGGILDNLLLAVELNDVGDAFTEPIHLISANVDLLDETRATVDSLPPDSRKQVVIEGEPATASADAHRVRQIIRNLLSNALMHGGKDIHVEIHESGNRARIVVADDGPGIAPPDIDRAFQRYESSRHDPGLTESLGIGLPVSRALAREMGGELQYDRKNDSTSFTLLLPTTEDQLR